MSKYRVRFSGFAYVEANTKDEAEKKYSDGDTVYEETDLEDCMEVDAFFI